MEKELNEYLIPDLTSIVLDYARDDSRFQKCMKWIRRAHKHALGICPYAPATYEMLWWIREKQWSRKRFDMLFKYPPNRYSKYPYNSTIAGSFHVSERFKYSHKTMSLWELLIDLHRV